MKSAGIELACSEESDELGVVRTSNLAIDRLDVILCILNGGSISFGVVQYIVSQLHEETRTIRRQIYGHISIMWSKEISVLCSEAEENIL